MRPEQDAYGQILHDIYTGENENAGEIIERDDGFIDYGGDATTYFEPYEEWNSTEQQAVNRVKGKVLDIGCAVGRHALYLQNNGYDVRGIDVSPKALEIAEDRGLKKTTQAGISDVKSLPEDDYDTVIMMGHNLGLLGTQPEEHLNALADVTSDDAILIGSNRDPFATDEQHHLQYHEFNKARGRRPGALRIKIRYRNYETPFFDYLFIDVDGLQNIVENTPWEINETLHRDDGTGSYFVVLSK